MTRIFSLSWMVLVVVMASLTQAQATIVTYSSQSAWLAAVTGVTTIDFNSMSTGSAGTLLALGPALNQINVSVQGGSQVQIVPGNSYYGINDYSNVLADTNNFGAMHFNAAPSNTTSILALAANLFTGSGTQGSVIVNIYLSGSPSTLAFTTTLTTNNGSSQTPLFFGVTSDVAIDHVDFITLTNSDGPVVIDNLQWGQLNVISSPTPELPTFAYLAIGMAGLFLGLRRRQLLA